MIHYLRRLATGLRELFGSRRAERELEDEIETRLRLLAERYVRQGMDEAEAAWAARRQFGNVTLRSAYPDHARLREVAFKRYCSTFSQALPLSSRRSEYTASSTVIRRNWGFLVGFPFHCRTDSEERVCRWRRLNF